MQHLVNHYIFEHKLYSLEFPGSIPVWVLSQTNQPSVYFIWLDYDIALFINALFKFDACYFKSYVYTFDLRLTMFLNFWSQIRKRYPLNLSILLSGGRENNSDSLSSGDRTGNSPNLWCLGTTGVVGLRSMSYSWSGIFLESLTVGGESPVHVSG